MEIKIFVNRKKAETTGGEPQPCGAEITLKAKVVTPCGAAGLTLLQTGDIIRM